MERNERTPMPGAGEKKVRAAHSVELTIFPSELYRASECCTNRRPAIGGEICSALFRRFKDQWAAALRLAWGVFAVECLRNHYLLFVDSAAPPPCFHSAFPFVSAGVFPCLDPMALPVLLLSRVGRLNSVR